MNAATIMVDAGSFELSSLSDTGKDNIHWTIIDDRETWNHVVDIKGRINATAQRISYGNDISYNPCCETWLILINYNKQDVSRYISLADNIILLYTLNELDSLNIEHRDMLLDIRHDQLSAWVERNREAIQYFIKTYHMDNIIPCISPFCHTMRNHSKKFYEEMSTLLTMTKEECDEMNKHEYRYDALTYEKPIRGSDLAEYKYGYVFDAE